MTLFSHITLYCHVLVPFTGKYDFVVCGSSSQDLAKRSGIIKLYRIPVPCEIDFAKYPVVSDLLRHKGIKT